MIRVAGYLLGVEDAPDMPEDIPHVMYIESGVLGILVREGSRYHVKFDGAVFIPKGVCISVELYEEEDDCSVMEGFDRSVIDHTYTTVVRRGGVC